MAGYTRRFASLLTAARKFDPAAHVRLACEGASIGWLTRQAARRLSSWPLVFEHAGDAIRIAAGLRTPRQRTHAVDEVVAALHEEGAITGWRNERYAVVTGFEAPPKFHIERAAARYFGVTTYAAHANGYWNEGGVPALWLARRAATKPIDPGLLDNLVGGGMAAGVTPLDALVREAWEEAGIPAEVARGAIAIGTLHLLRSVPEGVQAECIFAHDLDLPPGFVPRNQDGEVAQFLRVPIAEAAGLVLGKTAVTLDAALVTLISLARREGWRLPPEARGAISL